MPFLLDVFRIPADTFQLFLATGVINSRFGTLVAAVHTVAVALLGSAAIAGTLRFDARRLMRYAITTAVLTAVTVGGLRITFRTVLAHEFRGADVVYGMTNLLDAEPARVVEAAPTIPEQPPTLERIKASGALRVGFMESRLPFAFRNARQELVGFDVELAMLLARDLGVTAAFIAAPSGALVDAVSQGRADIGIGGTAVTPALAAGVRFSAPYLDETVAFVVKDHLRSPLRDLGVDSDGDRPGDRRAGGALLPAAAGRSAPGLDPASHRGHPAGRAGPGGRTRCRRPAGGARLGPDPPQS